MSDNRKLFSAGDEFDFKRKFVIEFLALRANEQYNEYHHTHAPFEWHKVNDALAMADVVWDAMVEHGVNDSKPKEQADEAS